MLMQEILSIPYCTRVLNFAIQSFCIKSRVYKIAIADFNHSFIKFTFLKNKSEILKSARCGCRDYTRILIPRI